MACAVERLRQAARDAPVVLLLGRLEKEGLDPQFPNPVTWRPPTQLGTNVMVLGLRELVEDAVESGSKERVLTPASQRVCGLLIVAGATAIKQSLSLPKAD